MIHFLRPYIIGGGQEASDEKYIPMFIRLNYEKNRVKGSKLGEYIAGG